MPDQLRLSRQQLSTFLPDFESIKAFENLFMQATVTTPANTAGLEEVLYSVARAARTPDAIVKRLESVEARVENRGPSLTDIYQQLAEIKAFLGMQ